MFINLTDFLKRESNIKFPYQGEVVDNVDPLKHGRIKCTVPELWDGATDKLPWVYPHNSSFLGGSTSEGKFNVPEIGSKLIIEFPFEDIYAPFYTGFWEGSATHSAEFDTDYPNTYGFVDSKGNKFLINKEKGDIEITHKSGTVFAIKDNGDMELTGTNNVKITSTGDIQMNGELGFVLTNITDPVVDFITGAPTQGVINVKAGLV